ncbi:DNA-binding domain-containing protein, AraC-type [Opitutaceae bacterium TAV1]|nr:DNA-binding domain-containing protein, AraC-type [Opitutaceae bacterium TAV1]
MKNRETILSKRLVRGLPEPDDYFIGLRRLPEELPDNVLLFARRSIADLHRPADITSTFHQRWVLVVAMTGGGTVVLDQQPHRLTPGHVLLVPPLHLHAYENVDPQLLWLYVTFEWPGHTALSEAWRGGPRRLSGAASRRLGALFAAWRGPEADGLVAAAHLLALLRSLFPNTETETKGSEPEGLIAAIQAGAAADPGGTLVALARRVGLSESHLRARFRREVGISLGRYLREARLRQAAVWIGEGGMSVKEAASRAGYPDMHTFSRAFSRVLGQPPSSMRGLSGPARGQEDARKAGGGG